MIVLMWLQLTIRWLLPRFRFDQIQKLCWKILLPVALANIFVTGALLLLVDPLAAAASPGSASSTLVDRRRPSPPRSAALPARRREHGTPPTPPSRDTEPCPTSSRTGRPTCASGCTSRRSSGASASVTRHFLRNLFFARDRTPTSSSAGAASSARGQRDAPVPRGAGAVSAGLPRPAPARAARGRQAALRRLLHVRDRLPGAVHLHRGGRVRRTIRSRSTR